MRISPLPSVSAVTHSIQPEMSFKYLKKKCNVAGTLYRHKDGHTMTDQISQFVQDECLCLHIIKTGVD